ncbi:MAG: DUF1573 domain-containing protein [Patescibacteria group bacterium]
MRQIVHTGSDRTILWLIGGFTVLILVLIGFVATGEQKEAKKIGQVAAYQSTDAEKPVVTFDTEIKNLGNMKVSDEKSSDFIVKNTGAKPLSLFNINSSCGCTAGVVTIGGQKSPEGAMHLKNSWIGTVNPSDTATVTVIYRPSVMPVKGDVSRSVYVETNDPANAKLTFTVKAFVE